MKARILIDLAGNVTILVDKGATFEEAARASEKILAAIGSVAKLEYVGQPEQHRHDDAQATLGADVHTHGEAHHG